MLRKMLMILVIPLVTYAFSSITAVEAAAIPQGGWKIYNLKYEQHDSTFYNTSWLERYDFAYTMGRILEQSGAKAGGMSFPDVPKNHWASKYVDLVASYGLISGVNVVMNNHGATGNGLFGGEYAVSRMDTVRAVAKLMKIYGKGQITQAPKFDDVPPDHPDYEAVSLVCGNGIFGESIEGTKFNGRKPVDKTIFIFTIENLIKELQNSKEDKKYFTVTYVPLEVFFGGRPV